MLAELANKISQTPPPPRDPEAEDYIRSSIGRRPDALYLMTQTVLIQNMALQRAQQQIQDLQQRSQQPVAPQMGGGSFLGQSTPSYGGGQQYAAPVSYGPPPSAMSGFLRSAAQTAAGVAVGTLAVQGIESLFSHHEGFGGSGFGGGFGGAPVEEIIENNYYGGSDPHDHDRSDRFADSGSGSDVADSLGPQDDADYDDSNYDDSSDDDSSTDDLT
jgi:hypothetical protein